MESITTFKKSIYTKSKTADVRKRMTHRERVDFVKEAGEIGLFLYEYYLDKADSPVHNLLDDNRVAKALGWTARKTAYNRLALEKAGWIRFTKQVHKGTTNLLFILGKDKVSEFDYIQ